MTKLKTLFPDYNTMVTESERYNTDELTYDEKLINMILDRWGEEYSKFGDDITSKAWYFSNLNSNIPLYNTTKQILDKTIDEMATNDITAVLKDFQMDKKEGATPEEEKARFQTAENDAVRTFKRAAIAHIDNFNKLQDVVNMIVNSFSPMFVKIDENTILTAEVGGTLVKDQQVEITVIDLVNAGLVTLDAVLSSYLNTFTNLENNKVNGILIGEEFSNTLNTDTFFIDSNGLINPAILVNSDTKDGMRDGFIDGSNGNNDEQDPIRYADNEDYKTFYDIGYTIGQNFTLLASSVITDDSVANPLAGINPKLVQTDTNKTDIATNTIDIGELKDQTQNLDSNGQVVNYPTNDDDIANKKYVDDNSGGGTGSNKTSDLIDDSNTLPNGSDVNRKITNIVANSAAFTVKNPNNETLISGSNTELTFNDGGTSTTLIRMLSNGSRIQFYRLIDMQDNKIIGLENPVSDDEVTNKGYVDVYNTSQDNNIATNANSIIAIQDAITRFGETVSIGMSSSTQSILTGVNDVLDITGLEVGEDFTLNNGDNYLTLSSDFWLDSSGVVLNLNFSLSTTASAVNNEFELVLYEMLGGTPNVNTDTEIGRKSYVLPTSGSLVNVSDGFVLTLTPTDNKGRSFYFSLDNTGIGSIEIHQANSLIKVLIGNVGGSIPTNINSSNVIDNSATSPTSGINTKLNQVGTNTGNITTNTTNIGTNAGQISTNTTNVADRVSKSSSTTLEAGVRIYATDTLTIANTTDKEYVTKELVEEIRDEVDV